MEIDEEILFWIHIFDPLNCFHRIRIFVFQNVEDEYQYHQMEEQIEEEKQILVEDEYEFKELIEGLMTIQSDGLRLKVHQLIIQLFKPVIIVTT